MNLVSSGSRQLTMAALAAAELTLDEPEVSRKELSGAAREAMRALCLRPSLRAVLSEIVGCWGETLVSDRILVWPSNEYLVEKTGLSERAVRYAIHGLVQASVLIPKDSANGKRFAIKGRGGKVLDAFGFDLTPLYARREEWASRVQAQRDARDARRRAQDEVTICRRAIEGALSALTQSYPSHDRERIEQQLAGLVSKTPRRNVVVPIEQLRDLVEAYRILRKSAELSFFQAGSGGKPCSLIESDTQPLSNRCSKESGEEDSEIEWYSPPTEHLSLRLILDACPALASYTEPITNERQFVEAGRFLRASIGAHGTAWFEAVERIGALRAAVAVAIVLQLHEDDQSRNVRRIKNPGGYFRNLVRLIQRDAFDLNMTLMEMRRKRLS